MTDAVRARFDRFAREEAPGRSAVYASWAAGIADDAEVGDLLARIDERHRQPPLVFAVSRMLGARPGPYAAWRAFVLAHDVELVARCERATVQTNEPLRTSALLPALSRTAGPVALLELGAAAGLCLYPDRYSFRLVGEDGAERARWDPADGQSPVLLTSTVRGALPPLRMPEIVWRAGVDLAPIDVRDPAGRSWIDALIWPGEHERAQRIGAAAAVVAADPPALFAGDALDLLEQVAATAPSGATLVVSTPGLLVYLPREVRRALIDRIRALDAHWVTIDPPALHDGWRPPIRPDAFAGFAVGLDGVALADADPLGRWWEWRPDAGEDAP